MEASFQSDGSTGALVYPQRPVGATSVAQFVLPRLDACWREECRSLIAAIPSARHAVRVGIDGATSVFWPIDLDDRELLRLATALEFESFARSASDFLKLQGAKACGLAIEYGGARHPRRLRIYQMLSAESVWRDAMRVAGQLAPELGAAASEALNGAWSLWARQGDVVLNLDSGSGNGFRLKLEFPAISVARALQSLNLNARDRLAFDRARAVADALGRSCFSYLGVRVSAGSRTLTFYVDARKWILNDTVEGEQDVDDLYACRQADASLQPGL